MSKEHVIADELFNEANIAFSKGDHWVAYNTIPYFLEKGDIHFFKTANEAHEFSDSNISEYDNYRVLHAYSADELLKQIPYGQTLERRLAGPDANGLYNTEGNAFADALIEHIEQQQIVNNKNVSVMNNENFEYLKDNIKYLGFGEKQHDELEARLKEGKDSFQMTYATEVNKRPFEAVLNFRKSGKSDMYFLNSYKASLEWANGEKKEQTFYLNFGKGVTAKEAFNLLSGRSVKKELIRKLSPEEKEKFKAELKLPPQQKGLPENWEKAPTYMAWRKLNFDKKDEHGNYEVRQFHEKHGYNLKEAVQKFGVSEMDGGEKEKELLQSLRKGNIQSVSIDVNSERQKMSIEANPEYKTINIYDEKMNLLNREQRNELLEKLGGKELKGEGLIINQKNHQELNPEMKNGKEVKEVPQQKEKQESKEEMKQEKKAGKNNKYDDGEESLLPKKRTRQKKGLGLS